MPAEVASIASARARREDWVSVESEVEGVGLYELAEGPITFHSIEVEDGVCVPSGVDLTVGAPPACRLVESNQ